MRKLLDHIAVLSGSPAVWWYHCRADVLKLSLGLLFCAIVLTAQAQPSVAERLATTEAELRNVRVQVEENKKEIEEIETVLGAIRDNQITIKAGQSFQGKLSGYMATLISILAALLGYPKLKAILPTPPRKQ